MRGGGCGAFELPVAKAVTVFTFKRDEIKRPKVSEAEGAASESPLLGRRSGTCSVY